MSMNQADAAHVAAHLARMAEPGLGNELRDSLLRVVAHLNAQIARMNQPLFNPPAFPPQVVRDGDGLLVEVGAYGMQTGMSLRDYFAAKAVAALIAEPPWHQSVVSVSARLSRPEENDEAANFASAAYRIADVMLKERDK